MSKWLERLKRQKGPDADPTKTTKTVSVVSVGGLPGTSEIFERAAAPAVTVQDRQTLPANDPATAAPAATSPAPSTSCATCSHVTKARTCGEPEAAGLCTPGRFTVNFIDMLGNHGATCPAHQQRPTRPLPADDLPRLTPDELRQVIGWNDAEIARAGSYMQQADRHGFDVDVAERITDRLILRDRQGDDRRFCIECRHLNPAGQCNAARSGRLPGADRDLEPVKVTLHRCPSFHSNSRT